MQFNSVQSGNFLTGAKSVTDAVTEIYDTAQETGFQVDEVIKQANVNEAVKKVAAARRNALATEFGLELTASVKKEDIKTKRDKAIKDIWRPAVRMEGINRMAGKVAAGAYIMDESKKARAEFAELKKLRQERDAAAEKRAEEAAKRQQQVIDLLKQQGLRLEGELGEPNTSGNISSNSSNSSSNISSVTFPSNVSSNSSNPTPKQVFDFMKELGVSDIHAKGVLANIRGESNFQTGIMGDGGTSGGLFQMHDPEPGKGRFTNMVNNVSNWRTNWKGQIVHGLKDDRAPEYLKIKFDTPVQAANWFLHNYERPHQDHRPGRERLNESWLGSLDF